MRFSASATDAPPSAAALHLRDIFARAYYINSDKNSHRRRAIEDSLRGWLDVERWPAVMGGPSLLTTHKQVLRRGVEPHLLSRRCQRPCTLANANVTQWGMVGNYLSHLTLLEHVHANHKPDEAVLILQDDVALDPGWPQRVIGALEPLQKWDRVLLSWFGAERPADCDEIACIVRGPAGPGNDGKRYYHGLQAFALRASGARCLLDYLLTRRIKSIDSLAVNANCPLTFALRHEQRIGLHAGGSERAALDAHWRSGPLRQANASFRGVSTEGVY